ncbi:MAG: hypothetical protein HN996_05160 [Opitutae bacterium]|nr:hypothetical protein [Opitutae bacterium]
MIDRMKNILITILFLATLIHSFGDRGQSGYSPLSDSAKNFLGDYREDIRKSDPGNLHLQMSDLKLFEDLGRVLDEKDAWDYYEQAYPGLKAAYSRTFSHDTGPARVHKESQGHESSSSKFHKPHSDNKDEPNLIQGVDNKSLRRWQWIITGGLVGTILTLVGILLIINQPKSKPIEKAILEIRQFKVVTVVIWGVLVVGVLLFAIALKLVLIDYLALLLTPILFCLWYLISRAFRMNTLALNSDGFRGGYPRRFFKWSDIHKFHLDEPWLSWKVKPNVSIPLNIKKFEYEHGCCMVGCKTVFTGKELHELMKQLILESLPEKRNGILLHFREALIYRDKNFRDIPLESLPADERLEASRLIDLRGAIWASTIYGAPVDDDGLIDTSGFDSAEYKAEQINDQLRRRGWMVESPGGLKGFFQDFKRVATVLSHLDLGMQLRVGLGCLIYIALFLGLLFGFVYLLGFLFGYDLISFLQEFF